MQPYYNQNPMAVIESYLNQMGWRYSKSREGDVEVHFVMRSGNNINLSVAFDHNNYILQIYSERAGYNSISNIPEEIIVLPLAMNFFGYVTRAGIWSLLPVVSATTNIARYYLVFCDTILAHEANINVIVPRIQQMLSWYDEVLVSIFSRNQNREFPSFILENFKLIEQFFSPNQYINPHYSRIIESYLHQLGWWHTKGDQSIQLKFNMQSGRVLDVIIVPNPSNTWIMAGSEQPIRSFYNMSDDIFVTLQGINLALYAERIGMLMVFPDESINFSGVVYTLPTQNINANSLNDVIQNITTLYDQFMTLIQTGRLTGNLTNYANW